MPQAPPAPPPPEERSHPRGVTDDLNPLDQRGGLVLASSVFASAEERLGGGSFMVQGRLHVAKHVYLDTTLPLAFSTSANVGNPTVEVRGVVPLDAGKNFFLVGGGLGLPVLTDDSQDFRFAPIAAAAANGLWDMHLYTPWSVPMIVRLGTEHFFGRLAVLRLQVDPVFEIPYGDNEEPELQLQHAVELQLGPVVGGGLRLQGVVLPTYDNTDNELGYEDDLYQLSMEPFFSYEGDVFSTRLGLMLPLDSELGPPFAEAWGFRMGIGLRYD
jgi:hypothetical protein